MLKQKSLFVLSDLVQTERSIVNRWKSVDGD